MNADENSGPQLHEDEGFQRREWAVQRAAWVVFSLILACAAIGLFGGGPLSTATETAEGVQIEFARFARRERPFDLVVRLEAATAETVTVEIGSEFLSGAAVQSITPRPEHERAGAGGARFEFAATPGEPAVIRFRVLCPEFGRRTAMVRVDGKPLSVSTLVYP